MIVTRRDDDILRMASSPLNDFIRDLMKEKGSLILADDNAKLESSVMINGGALGGAHSSCRETHEYDEDDEFDRELLYSPSSHSSVSYSPRKARSPRHDLLLPSRYEVLVGDEQAPTFSVDSHYDRRRRDFQSLDEMIPRRQFAVAKVRRAASLPLAAGRCSRHDGFYGTARDWSSLPRRTPVLSPDDDDTGYGGRQGAKLTRSKTVKSTMAKSGRKRTSSAGGAGSPSKESPPSGRVREKRSEVNARRSPVSAESVSTSPPARPMRKVSHELVASLEEMEWGSPPPSSRNKKAVIVGVDDPFSPRGRKDTPIAPPARFTSLGEALMMQEDEETSGSTTTIDSILDRPLCSGQEDPSSCDDEETKPEGHTSLTMPSLSLISMAKDLLPPPPPHLNDDTQRVLQ